MKKIKMIWDFRGPDAEATARHHAIHLEQYLNQHKLLEGQSGIEVLNSMHSIAFMLCTEQDKIKVRDELRPQRAEWHQPD